MLLPYVEILFFGRELEQNISASCSYNIVISSDIRSSYTAAKAK